LRNASTFKESLKKIKTGFVEVSSDFFDYLNEHTDGRVGYNHIYYSFDNKIYLVYYILSDEAKFVVLQIDEI